jgi:hypothetical protein
MLDQEIAENKGTKKGLIWETIKMQICGLTISYSSYKVKQTRLYEDKIHKRLKEVELEISISPNDNNKPEFSTLTKELEGINNERSSNKS